MTRLSGAEVPMRRIGLAVALTFALILITPASEAQQAGKVSSLGIAYPNSPKSSSGVA